VHPPALSALTLGMLAIICLVVSASAAGPETIVPGWSSPRGFQIDAPQSIPAEQAIAANDVPAHIAILDGAAILEREGRPEPAIENTPLAAGDRLRTERGRAEVLFADGSTIDLDEYTSVDFQSDSLLRLMAGRTRLSIARFGGTTLTYRVDTVPASVVIRTAGDYRIELSEPRAGVAELDVAVLRGAADLQNTFGRTSLRAGTASHVTSGAEPSLALAFNSAVADPFDEWVEAQRTARYGVTSAQYLPSDLRYDSGTLDENGDWAYEQSYGYVWYPRVAAVWRPYSVGTWWLAPRFGWTWIGFDRWSWVTCHYGRWGLNGSRWFWIPDNRWGPGWVSWASGPGYVGWCPLGFDGRAVVSLAAASYSRGWTTLPTRSFRSNVAIARAAIPAQQLSLATRSSLAVRSAPPATVMAASRAVPLRSPTLRSVSRSDLGVAVPRSASPTGVPSRMPPGAAASRAPRSDVQPDRTRPQAPYELQRSETPRAVPRGYQPAPGTVPTDRSRGPGSRSDVAPSGTQDESRATGLWRVNPQSGQRGQAPNATPRHEAPPSRAGTPPPPSSGNNQAGGNRSQSSGSGREGQAGPPGRGR
jgi:hypothetical protein